jgi:hypothetical protein
MVDDWPQWAEPPRSMGIDSHLKGKYRHGRMFSVALVQDLTAEGECFASQPFWRTITTQRGGPTDAATIINLALRAALERRGTEGGVVVGVRLAGRLA